MPSKFLRGNHIGQRVNILDEFDRAVARWPDEIAVVHREKRLSFVQLSQAVQLVMDSLRRLGIEPGQKVGHLFANSPEHLVVTLGIMGVGAVVVYLSPLTDREEIVRRVQEYTLDAICYAQHLAPLLTVAPANLADELKVFDDNDHTYVLKGPSTTPDEEQRLLANLQAAVIGSSSGTTGQSKGIISSHLTVLARAKEHQQALPLQAGDALLWVQPLARTPGPYVYQFAGVKVVIGDAFEANAIAILIRREGVTQIYTAPMFYQTILRDEFPADGLTGVRYLLCGGSTMGAELASQVFAKFCLEVVEHYGSSETGTVFINKSLNPAKRGSIGLPHFAEAKLSSGAGQVLAGEATGELVIRCEGMFDAYYRPWRLRERALPNGWFNTGDVARRDADGYYWIVGRVKEMINVAGLKVFPQDIETILLGLDDVEEAVVFAVANQRFGEVPHAKVKLRAGATRTAKEIMAYANDRLPVFKSLRGVEIVESIAKTLTGKVKRLG